MFCEFIESLSAFAIDICLTLPSYFGSALIQGLYRDHGTHFRAGRYTYVFEFRLFHFDVPISVQHPPSKVLSPVEILIRELN